LKTTVLSAFTGLLLLCTPARAETSPVAPVLPIIPEATFNITNFGAIGDGISTNTSAIQAAINAAGSKGGGIVEVPAGVYLSGPFRLTNKINFHIDAGATLLMLPLDKYPGGTSNPETFISGYGLHDVTISGTGTIDGQGSPWWPFARVRFARRPRMIGGSKKNKK